MILYVLVVVIFVAMLGSLLETYQPGFFSETFKRNMSAITLGSVGILFSLLLLMILLKPRVREGFQANALFENRDNLFKYYKLKEICTIYPDIYNKIVTVEKGPPPSIVTDAQARERAEKIFQDEMRTKLFNCKKYKEIQSASTLDSLFESLYTVENDFFVQALETLLACRELMINQYNKVQSAKQQRKEGFQTLCDTDVAAEKRKAIKEKQKEAERKTCKLPEEISPQDKEDFCKKKLSLLTGVLLAHINKYQIKDTFEKILEDCQYYTAELEKDKQAAEKGTIGTPAQKTSSFGF